MPYASYLVSRQGRFDELLSWMSCKFETVLGLIFILNWGGTAFWVAFLEQKLGSDFLRKFGNFMRCAFLLREKGRSWLSIKLH